MHPQGTILLVRNVLDPQGCNPKEHPVVAITFPDGNLLGVAVTTTFAKPLRELEIELAYATDGRCFTGLREPSVAVADWYVDQPVGDIVRRLGFAGKAELDSIVALLKKISQERSG